MAFAHDFKENVIPRMREEAKKWAFLLAVEDIYPGQTPDEPTFEDAASAVTLIAIKGGVGLLAWDHKEAVLEGVADVIWVEYIKALARCRKWGEESGAAREADPVSFYESLAEHCTKPNQMRWVFAAGCPEYRSWLLSRPRDERPWPEGAACAR